MKTVYSSGFRLRAWVTWRQICTASDWNVENGFEPSDGPFSLTFALILSMAASENLKTFSLSTGSCLAAASPLDWECGSGGSEGSSFTRVLRDFVRSRNGGTETEVAPLQAWAHELMKCHVEVPSRIA